MSEGILESRKLFLERMDREGKRAEVEARVKLLMNCGAKHSRAIRTAMKEFGFESLAMEKALLVAHLDRVQGVRGSLDPRVVDMEEALAGLPTKAADAVSVLAWIAAHPAMKRQSKGEGAGRVEITAEDVLYASHGPAPSREAVGALEHYANAPAMFWKEWIKVRLDVEKKAAQPENEDEPDDGLVDVEKMLNQVQSRAKKEWDL